MPHVATDTKTYAPKPTQPQPVRPQQASDRPQGAFESMIDDNAASTSAAREQSAADRAQDTPPAKAKPSKSASDSKPAANDAPAKADKADKTAKSDDTSKTDATEKPETEAKTDEAAKADPAATTDKNDPAAAVPGTLTMPDGTLAVALPLQTPTPAEAQPATPAATEDAQAPVIAALAGQAQGAVDPTAVQGKDGKPGKDKPAETAKPAEGDDGKLPTEAQAANGKAAHVPLSDAEIEHIARARGEADENPRHAVKEAAHTDTQAPAPKVTTDLPTPQLQAPTQTAPTTAASAAATAAAPQAAAQTPVPLAGVPVEIAAKAREGKNNFDIRLDPPELGRIEVRLNIDRDGNVTSRLIADRQDTLDLLKRDSSGLERALQDAGLKTSDNAMQFSLRDQSLSQQQDNGKNTGGETARMVAQDDTLPIIDTPVQSYGRLAGRGGGLDIRV